MPRFEPFPGLRYAPDIALDDVIAPPYDVVGPEEREKLASRHRANAIHIELPVEQPGSGLNRYESAATLLEQWIRDGVLRSDAPSMYRYRMTEPDGTATTGVIGALGCESEGGDVLAHEQTIPKDMSDRLELLRATHANISPIWGLSLSSGLSDIASSSTDPDEVATDDDGVRHELWAIDDHTTVEGIKEAVGSAPVVIADGHHRYETALAYQSERRAAAGGRPGDYDFVMALVVELSERQLSVGAINRVLVGTGGPEQLRRAFANWFALEDIDVADARALRSVLDRKDLTVITRGQAWKLTVKPRTEKETDSDLDSSHVARALDDLEGVSVDYVHDPEEAFLRVSSGAADACVTVRPVTVQQISNWAHARRRMPPKSTYFHPKPRTGMVFRRLAD